MKCITYAGPLPDDAATVDVDTEPVWTMNGFTASISPCRDTDIKPR